MDKNKLWVVGSVLVMVVVLALGWFLGISPQLSDAAGAGLQSIDVQAMNLTQEATLAKLKKDYADIGALKAKLADLSESVPSDSAIPAFQDEVDAAGAAAGVTVAGFAVADAKPYQPVSAPAGAGSAATPAPTASAAPAATPTPRPTAVAGMPPVTSPELTASNFSSLAVTLTVKGTYDQALAFVDGLQQGKRLFLVDGITTSATSASGSTGSAKGVPASATQTATISGLIFVVTPPAPGTPVASK